MDKMVLWGLVFCLGIYSVSAITITTNVGVNPSASNTTYLFCKDVVGLTTFEVNSTCMILNSTKYCTISTVPTYVPLFCAWGYAVKNYSVEWITLNWSVASGVDIDWSVDNASWQNITILDETNMKADLLYLYPDTIYYFRGIADLQDYGYISQRTKAVNERNIFYLYLFGLLVFVILLLLGYGYDEPWVLISAGMVASVIAIGVYMSDFDNLSNVFLKNGFVILMAGLGFYYLLMPSINMLKEYN